MILFKALFHFKFKTIVDSDIKFAHFEELFTWQEFEAYIKSYDEAISAATETKKMLMNGDLASLKYVSVAYIEKYGDNATKNVELCLEKSSWSVGNITFVRILRV